MGLVTGVRLAQIVSSKRLREVLEAVLAVGNALNQGTAFANTQAVRIESLLRLSDLRVCPL